ncbi:YciI family protein [Devosia sp. SL43]|uniref:YciI family protein n=1 Tax=Devosia sp. SL43 TaxID=2806348 RepID=UPI001F2626F3|nr:YciI family protein [Devosia sp. SL43]UJW84114.1 YciI family protein [Devosia sp. SL43]
MLYAVLCYNDENAVTAWSQEEDDAVMARLAKVEEGMKAKGKLGPVARLLPTTSATTLRKASGEALIIDGPFAETKEQFLGFYMVDCDSLDEAIAFAKDLAVANPGLGGYEIRPVGVFHPSEIG